jgi:amylosucrase
VEAALATSDPGEIDLAIERLTCAYAMVFGFGGLPLLYMGDELAMLNDHSFVDDPAKAADNRWVQRPAMDWSVADTATGVTNDANVDGVADRVFRRMRRLIEARKELPALHASVATDVFTTANPAVLVFRRRHAAGSIVQAYNLSEHPQGFDRSALWPLTGDLIEHVTGGTIDAAGDLLVIPPYGAWWLTSAS